jgi:hypothetical protein
MRLSGPHRLAISTSLALGALWLNAAVAQAQQPLPGAPPAPGAIKPVVGQAAASVRNAAPAAAQGGGSAAATVQRASTTVQNGAAAASNGVSHAAAAVSPGKPAAPAREPNPSKPAPQTPKQVGAPLSDALRGPADHAVEPVVAPIEPVTSAVLPTRVVQPPAAAPRAPKNASKVTPLTPVDQAPPVAHAETPQNPIDEADTSADEVAPTPTPMSLSVAPLVSVLAIHDAPPIPSETGPAMTTVEPSARMMVLDRAEFGAGRTAPGRASTTSTLMAEIGMLTMAPGRRPVEPSPPPPLAAPPVAQSAVTPPVSAPASILLASAGSPGAAPTIFAFVCLAAAWYALWMGARLRPPGCSLASFAPPG